MNTMLKDLDFWKPILFWIAAPAAYITILCLVPSNIALIISIGSLVIWFGYMLYIMGSASYSLKKCRQAEQYRKLTGRDINEKAE